jgi:hypothetical protein
MTVLVVIVAVVVMLVMAATRVLVVAGRFVCRFVAATTVCSFVIGRVRMVAWSGVFVAIVRSATAGVFSSRVALRRR